MEKELKLKTSWPSQSTDILFGVDFALRRRLEELIGERRMVVVCDSNTEKLYAPLIEHLDLQIFSFQSGETSKTRETKSMLEDLLLSHNFGRDTLIVALGGGVVCDVVGFLASTYCRGVPLVMIPTSLLAMVDASVGSKTAVNTPYGKNMIGTFYPPEEVLIDAAFLETLPEKQWRNGVAEILKSALIASPSLFLAMKDCAPKWKERDLDFIMERIYESVVIKKDIVEADPEEEGGLRRILNLGHTFGHALEVLEDFAIEHGEAIAIGMLVSCYISEKMGLLPIDSLREIRGVFELYDMPLHLSKEHNFDDLMSILSRDKKSLQGIPRFVLLEEIGKPSPFGGEYCTEVEFPLLEEAIDWMHQEFLKR